jgi:taurine dioxygenase
MAPRSSQNGAQEFRIEPLTMAIGAEIVDIDLSQSHSDAVYKGIREALYRWGVIFFREQSLTPEKYLALGNRFGVVEEKATLGHVEGFPQIGRLVKEANHFTSIGDMWHTDHTYMAHPIGMTMLHAIEVPPSGGDTLFAHAGRAFAGLPEGVKQTLRGLRALHSRSYLIKDPKAAAQYQKERPVVENEQGKIDARKVHPAVKAHPETGEEVLFLNPGYVVKFDGWTSKLSAALLESLYAHTLQDENLCRFRWRKGSIAIWDNRLVWHKALNDYHGQRREMHRMMIA